MLQQNSELSDHSVRNPTKPSLRHQRSLSDIALGFVHGSKRDGLRNKDLKTLVRLCGQSSFFLPTAYAPCTLTLPTCFRALAQTLVQHGKFRLEYLMVITPSGANSFSQRIRREYSGSLARYGSSMLCTIITALMATLVVYQVPHGVRRSQHTSSVILTMLQVCSKGF
jgi:hypothetical protein